MKGVLFKACRQAGPSSGSDTRFEAVEALSQELVGVRPQIFSSLIIDIFTFAFICALIDDVSDNWILHGNARKFTDVCGC